METLTCNRLATWATVCSFSSFLISSSNYSVSVLEQVQLLDGLPELAAVLGEPLGAGVFLQLGLGIASRVLGRLAEASTYSPR